MSMRGSSRMRSNSLDANRRPDASGVAIQKPAAIRFYDECYQQGIPGSEVHAAVVESHGWEDKWLNDFREAGARNPSPPASKQEISSSTKKRDRLDYFRRFDSVSSSDLSQSSSSPSFHPQQTLQKPFKRLHSSILDVVSDSEDEEENEDVTPPTHIHNVVATAAPILRPIAVRIARPPSPLSLDQSTSIDLNAGRREPSPLEFSPPEMTQPIEEQQGLINIVEEEEEELQEEQAPSIPPEPTIPPLEAAKTAVLHALAISGGDEKSPQLEAALKPLLQMYLSTQNDARMWGLEGMWLTLTKPTYAGNMGENHGGDPMYTMGRMSFDMFRPTKLVCSLQGTFNSIEPVLTLEDCVAPKSLQEEVQEDGSVLRTYDIVTAFTIEPYQPDFNSSPNQNVHRPIRGIMTTHGYALPDPEVPNRLSIWFTGGMLQPNDNPQDQEEWKRMFCSGNLPERSFGEKAMVLAAKMLMGATLGEVQENGTMSYEFTRPLGGHGMAYVDVLYLDHGLRIVRGHKGTLFVFLRVPDHTHDT